GYQPEGHKGHPVEHGVFENQPDGRVQRSRISEPFEERRAQQGGRPKGLPHRHVNAKKPDGYRNGTDRASHHALDNRVSVHGVASLCVTWVTADASTSANAEIGRAFPSSPRVAAAVGGGEFTTPRVFDN